MDVIAIIAKAYGRALNKRREANANSIAVALERHGNQFGLMKPHRLSQFLAQLFHESAAFQYDREVWGPTEAQRRYEGRRDLGNTQPGDGSKFRGYTSIQITGRANTTEFWKWCQRSFPSLQVPDFTQAPKLMNTDPWEGLGPIWYWDTRKLNRYADSGDVEMISRRINGGYNGYSDRLKWLLRVSLVMLGYKPDDVRGFQKSAGLTVDGIPGPRTRSMLHRHLVLLGNAQSMPDISLAPVAQSQVKDTVPESVDKEVKDKTTLWGWIMTVFGGGGVGIGAVLQSNWQTIAAFGVFVAFGLAIALVLGPQIIRRIKDIRQAIESKPARTPLL